MIDFLMGTFQIVWAVLCILEPDRFLPTIAFMVGYWAVDGIFKIVIGFVKMVRNGDPWG